MKTKLFTTILAVLFSIIAMGQTNTLVEQTQHQNPQTLYLVSHAYIFGTEYSDFKGEIQRELSDRNVVFVTAAANPEWIVYITAFAREYNKHDSGDISTYYAYVDLDLIIENAATGQRIYQGKFSEKGGHTHGFDYAAQVAYQKLSSQISAIIIEKLQE